MLGMPEAATATRAGTAMVAGATGVAAAGARAARAATAGVGPGLELPEGGGEDCRTLGREISEVIWNEMMGGGGVMGAV